MAVALSIFSLAAAIDVLDTAAVPQFQATPANPMSAATDPRLLGYYRALRHDWSSLGLPYPTKRDLYLYGLTSFGCLAAAATSFLLLRRSRGFRTAIVDTVGVFSAILLAFSVLVYLAFPSPILLGLFAAFFVSGLKVGGYYVLSNGMVMAAALVGTVLGLSRRARPPVRALAIITALVVGATVVGIGASAYGQYAAGLSNPMLRQQSGGQAAVTCIREDQVMPATKVTHPSHGSPSQLQVWGNQTCYAPGAAPVISWER
jgi:hypothetical protein